MESQLLTCVCPDQSSQPEHLGSASPRIGCPARAAQSRAGNPSLRTSSRIVCGYMDSLGIWDRDSDASMQPAGAKCRQIVRIRPPLGHARALTRTRERMFAKPFLAQLGNGHVQGIYSMCKVCCLSLFRDLSETYSQFVGQAILELGRLRVRRRHCEGLGLDLA